MSRGAARSRVARACVFLAFVVAVVGPVQATENDDDPLLARAFSVRYRPLADAADLVGPLLTAEGKVILRPRLKTLVVEDRVSVLDRVGALLESFDLPPRNVEVTFTLFLGTDRREEAGRAASNSVFSDQVRGVIEALGDFTKWTDYEPLGSRLVTGVEGDRLIADLSDDYRVLFTVESVSSHNGSDVVKFDSITLQRLVQDPSGARIPEDLHTTGVVLATGRLGVVGAASGADSKRALFLTLQVETR